MSIYINQDTRVIVQGMTGRLGSWHTKRLLEYGTKVVAGVTPQKGGEVVEGLPVYDTLAEAIRHHPAEAALTFVPGPFLKEAIMEGIDAGLKVIVSPVEGMPVKDMMIVRQALKTSGTILVGPNTPGIISADQCSIGILPGDVYRKGNVGIVSRSGTFSILIADVITKAGLGQTTALGIGGDPITGLGFIDVLAEFEQDPETKAITLIGEIGGEAEEEAAAYIQKKVKKPVVAIVGGRTAPSGQTMGHAGAIISGGRGSYNSKVEALKRAGVVVAESPDMVGTLLTSTLEKLLNL